MCLRYTRWLGRFTTASRGCTCLRYTRWLGRFTTASRGYICLRYTRWLGRFTTASRRYTRVLGTPGGWAHLVKHAAGTHSDTARCHADQYMKRQVHTSLKYNRYLCRSTSRALFLSAIWLCSSGLNSAFQQYISVKVSFSPDKILYG